MNRNRPERVAKFRLDFANGSGVSALGLLLGLILTGVGLRLPTMTG